MRVRVGNFFHDQHELFDPGWSFRVYEFVTHAGTDAADVARCIEYVVPDLTVYVRGSRLKHRRWVEDVEHAVSDAEAKVVAAERGMDLEIRRHQATEGHEFKRRNGHWVEEEIVMTDDDPAKVGWANGVVWTSWREEDYEAEPALLVSIGLYNQECSNPKCIAGHMNNRQSPILYKRAPRLEDWKLDANKEEVGEHPTYKLQRRAWEHNRDVLSTLGFLPVDAPLVGIKTEPEHLYRALDYLARIDEVKGSRGESGTFAYKAMELERLGYPVDPLKVQEIAQVRHLEGFLAPREAQVRDWLEVLNGNHNRE